MTNNNPPEGELMTDLNMTTAERLCAVADAIEAEPEKWNQQDFVGILGGAEIRVDEAAEAQWQADLQENAGVPIACGTTRCVAGWAVTLSPKEMFADLGPGAWEAAGQRALGLNRDLAMAMFYDMTADVVSPTILRQLSTLEEPRTLEAAMAAGIWPADDEDEEEDEVY